jgi:flavin reductase (DIM6/NTAB) family NADH-FMN oxidoreductase RutF
VYAFFAEHTFDIASRRTENTSGDHVRITPDPMPAKDIYTLLTGIVVPRPIAWATTVSPAGTVNLAPFSCFTFVSSKPPMIGINVGLREGQRKDTACNIRPSGDFTVNIADDSMIELIHRSAIAYGPDVSEADLLGLQTAQSERVKSPRLAIAPIALECRLHGIIEFGETGSEFTVGEVLMFHGLCIENKIETAKLRRRYILSGAFGF